MWTHHMLQLGTPLKEAAKKEDQTLVSITTYPFYHFILLIPSANIIGSLVTTISICFKH